MSGYGNFNPAPVIQISSTPADCLAGWPEIFAELHRRIPAGRKCLLALECYPGISLHKLKAEAERAFPGAQIFNVEEAYRPASVLQAELAPVLSDDPVFGFMQPWPVANYFHAERLAALQLAVRDHPSLTILMGAGTMRVAASPDLLIHAGVTRWELQRRQRAGTIGNLGLDNRAATPSLLYKNAFFVEWRTADEIRHSIFNDVDYFVDLDDEESPNMVSGETLRRAVHDAAHRPFRVAPFFDPGPWGGQWMKETFDLPDGPPNYAWCFDCVPEENSIVLGFGSRRFKIPAIIAVHEQPQALLGASIYQRFGAEFPIRFDLLDTIGGGNLSLQVHPLTSYIREHFGMAYTQDESYYILDQCEGSELYLGLRAGISAEKMQADLLSSQAGHQPFPATEYVNVWPTRRHDHFSIPAGTIHCSGSGNLVLEISATPYIFTFKLWDWGRLGLDSRPRPIHLQHGLANLQWDRDTDWVRSEILNQVEPIAEGHGWHEERTGLHRSEFLETRRTWFSVPTHHDTRGNLHVLNLVEGEAIMVESPGNAFPPTEIHYAETFIVPAAVGSYTLRPLGDAIKPMAVIKAYVRET